MARLPIPSSPDGLTPEWLTAALRESDILRSGRVVEAAWERVGASYGFTGVVARIHLGYDGARGEHPRSLVVKLPMAGTAQISGYRAVQERDPARMERYYERAAREVRFYRQVGAAFAPTMYYADADDAGRRVVLLLEDVSDGRQGDVLLGCSIDDAANVIRELAPFHARWWGGRAPRSDFPGSAGEVGARQERYAQQVEPFLARYGDRLPAAATEVISDLRFRLASLAEALSRGPKTLIHGDLHLDNMIFGPRGDERSVTVLDWQTASAGTPASDVALFVTDSLGVEERRAAETALLEEYVKLLAERGVSNYSAEELRADCGRALLLRLAGTIGWLTNVTGDHLTARERALQDAAIANGRLVTALQDYDALALMD